MAKGESPYREGGESCASCVELARENGELRAAQKGRRRLAWAQVAGGSAMVGGMIGGALMLTSWIHGCASTPPRPAEREPCRDSAEVISLAERARQCSLDATVFTEVLPSGTVLVRCVCAGGGGDVGPRSDPAGAR